MLSRVSLVALLLSFVSISIGHAVPLDPPVYRSIYSFSGADGSQPSGGLVEGDGGVFYGATRSGAQFGRGAVYQVNKKGELLQLHSFIEPQGYRIESQGGLVRLNGVLYGTTDRGGASDRGTIFKVSLQTPFQVIHNFNSAEGSSPNELEVGPDGQLYGTTRGGGMVTPPAMTNPLPGSGTIFRVGVAGGLNTLHVFHRYVGFGEVQPVGGLLKAADGRLYGMTRTVIVSDIFGAIYSIGTQGDYSWLGGFFVTGGAPSDKMTQTPDGKIYGVYPTGAGDYYNTFGALFHLPHRMRSEDYVFTQEEQGPRTVISGPNGELYLTTLSRVYRFKIGEGLKLLHAFGGGATGVHRLTLGTDGNLYGTVATGGTNSQGEVFSILLQDTPPVVEGASCSLQTSRKKKQFVSCSAQVSDDFGVGAVTALFGKLGTVQLTPTGAQGSYTGRIKVPANLKGGTFPGTLRAVDTQNQPTQVGLAALVYSKK